MKKITLLTFAMASVVISACGDKGDGPVASSQTQPTSSVTEHSSKPPSPPAQKKWEGPFGLAMGLTAAQIQASGTTLTAIPEIPGLMRSSAAPLPNSSFSEYLYMFGSDSGLCKVIASTAPIAANPFGDQIKSTFDELSRAITEKYGAPESHQFVKNGSIWTDSNDWMMSLAKEERFHASYWTTAKIPEMPNNIVSIGLTARAESPYKGYVSLAYEFSNFESCQDERKKLKNSSL